MANRVHVYDTRTGRKVDQPVPERWLGLHPHLKPVPSHGRIPQPRNAAPESVTVTEPSEAPPSAAVPPATDSGTAALLQED